MGEVGAAVALARLRSGLGGRVTGGLVSHRWSSAAWRGSGPFGLAAAARRQWRHQARAERAPGHGAIRLRWIGFDRAAGLCAPSKALLEYQVHRLVVRVHERGLQPKSGLEVLPGEQFDLRAGGEHLA